MTSLKIPCAHDFIIRYLYVKLRRAKSITRLCEMPKIIFWIKNWTPCTTKIVNVSCENTFSWIKYRLVFGILHLIRP